MKKIKLNVQINNCKNFFIPKKKKIIQWIKNILNQTYEITIRVVGIQEMQSINFIYRKQYKPTNILSFLYHQKYKHTILLGDLIICAQVIHEEAYTQKKIIEAHWAHIIIHGILHLIGYSHNNVQQAQTMEKIEINIMQKLGYRNPYII